MGLNLLKRTIWIIKQSKPNIWFIENPRGMMRKVIDAIFKEYGITDYQRHTVTYCQYGDKRMKPTDIWTNCKAWDPKPACKNGMPCHEAAPRGAKTGTQGLKGAIDRGVIPDELCDDLFLRPVTSKPYGTGLGLPFCRRALELHGGAIEINSQSKQGTTARIRILMSLDIAESPFEIERTIDLQ